MISSFSEQEKVQKQKSKQRLNMATPVTVLRLPKGPDPNSRGFDPKSPRFIALYPEQLPREQHARSVLRESFLRCLLTMVEATFRASDIDVLNFQVSDLHTPIGVQKEALIRCQDVISFTFDA
uniref:Gem (nuclear organelle) associated protein 7 n=1 Tax=Cyclopterus lumpus TaxID=8103 RepID=A0A8C3G3I3_CYCLU